jgi:hypothetical protein
VKSCVEPIIIIGSSMAGFKFRVGLAAAADTTIIMGARHAGVAMEQEKNDSPAPSGTHYQIN